MKEILYIITNISMPDICKVGITNNLENRLKSLNTRTSTPTRFQVYEKFDMSNAEIMEQRIFQYFSKERVNRKREFLKIHPERICDFIFENKNNNKKIEKETDGLFKKIGISEGELLKFKEGEDVYQNIIAKVGSGKNIFYKNKKTSLSKSSQDILRKKFNKDWKAVQGSLFWTYKGKSIRELMDENNL